MEEVKMNPMPPEHHEEGEMITKPMNDAPIQKVQRIGSQQVIEAREVLMKYKEGKKNLEDKIVEKENWGKLRHWEQVRKKDSKFPCCLLNFN